MGGRLALAGLAVVLTLGGLLVVDRTVGWLGWSVPGLVLPPHHRLTYRTPEFAFEVRTNALGFRDGEVTETRSSGVRIVALGDSFTYGFGVAAEESWPKLLERALRAEGSPVEVANLGAPGIDPNDYAAIAIRAIPRLRPALVIVGLLQGDDLAQLSQYRDGACPARRPPSLGSVVRRVYPHLAEVVRPSATARYATLSEHWRAQAAAIVAEPSPIERERFQRLEPRIRQAFLDGHVNPSLLQIVLIRPSFYMDTLVPGPHRDTLVTRMARCLATIRDVARVHAADTVALAVPHGPYTRRRDWESRRRLGFDLSEEALTSEEMDRTLAAAAARAGVPWLGVTARFRGAPEAPPLFFELDGHFTPMGHRLFADAVAPWVQAQLRR